MAKKHDIIWLNSIDSTNEEARRHISDIDNLSVLSAWEQTAGRGQRGNRWFSKAGENLLFSIVLKFSCGDSSAPSLPKLSAREQFVLNEITSLSVVDFLSLHGIQAEVKWPNDVYVGDRKICGILIENSLRGPWLSSSIVGIGLNINQRNFNVNLPNPTSMVLSLPENMPSHLPCHPDSPYHNEPHSCHPELHSCHPERSEGSFQLPPLLEEFMDIFISYHAKYLSAGNGFSALRQQYLSRLWRLGRNSRFIDFTTLPDGHLNGPIKICTGKVPETNIPSSDQSGNEFPGIIRGLSEIGNLLVEDLSADTIREFGFKEIGFIL